jgi:hypothetical protein
METSPLAACWTPSRTVAARRLRPHEHLGRVLAGAGWRRRNSGGRIGRDPSSSVCTPRRRHRLAAKSVAAALWACPRRRGADSGRSAPGAAPPNAHSTTASGKAQRLTAAQPADQDRPARVLETRDQRWVMPPTSTAIEPGARFRRLCRRPGWRTRSAAGRASGAGAKAGVVMPMIRSAEGAPARASLPGPCRIPLIDREDRGVLARAVHAEPSAPLSGVPRAPACVIRRGPAAGRALAQAGVSTSGGHRLREIDLLYATRASAVALDMASTGAREMQELLLGDVFYATRLYFLARAVSLSPPRCPRIHSSISLHGQTGPGTGQPSDELPCVSCRDFEARRGPEAASISSSTTSAARSGTSPPPERGEVRQSSMSLTRLWLRLTRWACWQVARVRPPDGGEPHRTDPELFRPTPWRSHRGCGSRRCHQPRALVPRGSGGVALHQSRSSARRAAQENTDAREETPPGAPP